MLLPRLMMDFHLPTTAVRRRQIVLHVYIQKTNDDLRSWRIEN